ncbi:membrane protein, putative [Oceanicola granulosus HTCC2516]|uniref:Membrane protein, putative n=1 Tax=Oceanicola granulosus (strain ATCC BAA-861 / DSM 15982 / KCTC 12143 / HTCC2516) TaxID=314256 RepID=Q2CBF7_OCEGH|nr:DMT family transporter [Oceanicola granulosus]EAR50006.1 membrane protein, putative [Oceanicola granulosus HTCC2516]
MTEAPTRANWLSILLLGLIWGGTFMVVRIALDGYGPITVACARTTLGAAATLALMVALRKPMPPASARLWGYIVAIGVTSTALPFFLLSWGQQFVPSAFAGLTIAAIPLFLLPMAHFFADDPLSLRKLGGVTLGFAGALVLIGPGLAQLGAGGEPLGQLACLAATVCYAASSTLTRRCPPIDPFALAALTLVVGAAVLVPAMLVFEGVPAVAPGAPTVAIIALGLLPTALAVVLRTLVIRSAGPVFMTLVNYQVPLWSMLFGWLVLSEQLPGRFFAALGLILIGLGVSQWPSLRRLARRVRREERVPG